MLFLSDRFQHSHNLPSRISLVVEALYFQQQQIGFVLFEVGPQDGKLYEILRKQLSSALQGTLLLQQVQNMPVN
jgi:hypothetical protein